AAQLMKKALVWDNHACMPLRPDDGAYIPQIERMRAAGVDVVSLNVGFGPQSLQDHLRMLASFRRWFAQRKDHYVLVRSPADIDGAKAAGKLAIAFDIEGMGPLDEGDHGVVELFSDLGVRWMSVAYNRNNAVGGGCYDDDPGLSAFGAEVLAEMKRVGMVVCCSHTGHRTTREVIAKAGNPVIFSHSNPSGVYNHTRNIGDDLMHACAENGGVIGINGIGPFLSEGDASAQTLVRHIDYAVQLVGPGHVGIGLDYVFDREELAEYLRTMRETFPDDSTYSRPTTMVPPEALSEITQGLCDLGYDDDAVLKILGGNWRRIAQSVWRT
ncbi:MAG: membrane dipeptidase, partial [Candidatus Eremiobacteraeota bacterium]|nr:membrane dipeptidase [Candidatus Eremiobacteraeota bacterium]